MPIYLFFYFIALVIAIKPAWSTLFSPSFWLFHMVCGVLVPQPGTEHISPAMEALSLNHWAAKQVPILQFLTQTGGSVNAWDG